VGGVVLADNAGMLHLLEATDLHWSSTINSGVQTLRAQHATDDPPPSADP
jgi:hypothetical protein